MQGQPQRRQTYIGIGRFPTDPLQGSSTSAVPNFRPLFLPCTNAIFIITSRTPHHSSTRHQSFSVILDHAFSLAGIEEQKCETQRLGEVTRLLCDGQYKGDRSHGPTGALKAGTQDNHLDLIRFGRFKDG
ncbi:hypothetical protein N7G274_009339 [Stereocaulon virgatum]|uniref:Uncharacterized protein n=1 Tax=Stereocaulon virgatum TaxID=373712 RepID=A0ABR3ZW86_9LECA